MVAKTKFLSVNLVYSMIRVEIFVTGEKMSIVIY